MLYYKLKLYIYYKEKLILYSNTDGITFNETFHRVKYNFFHFQKMEYVIIYSENVDKRIEK